ncbi:ABC transporter ATP-binding protein [Paraburkholderia sp. A3BS-1L]|uniref:ABC transporter ATP-binding protein n=1 Tax=Paraburkholderia sp. A3BS-1L TaxID=3028375 RepID=UPI003DA7BC97
MTSPSLRNVVAGYGTVNVLHGVSLDVPGGEMAALLGTNGNGKSTLIRAILGIVPVSSGSIVLEQDGQRWPLHEMRTEAIVDLGIGVVAEGRRLFGNLSVRENLLLGAWRRAARRLRERNLDAVFEAFPVLRERAGQLVGTMSGGQQQMVAIGRALMTAPRVLLVDEPSVGLAPAVVKETLAQIARLKTTLGLTVLIAEQSFHQATAIADRAYVIAHGAIVMYGDDIAAAGSGDAVREIYLGA